VTKFLLSLGGDGKFVIDLEDEVVRGSIVVHNGNILPRVVPPPVVPPTILATPTAAEAAEAVAITPWKKVSQEVMVTTAGMSGVLALGKATGTDFMDSFFIFGLAALVGYR
jgi:NAD(P) transhydrogenase